MSRSGCRCLLSGALRREHSPSRLRNLSRCAFACALCVSLRFSFQRSKRSPVFGRRFGLPKLGAWFEACKFFLCSASVAVSKPFGWSRLSCESGLYSGPERVVQVFLFAPFASLNPVARSRLSCESGLYSGPERVVQAFLFRPVRVSEPSGSESPLLRERPLFETGASRASFSFRLVRVSEPSGSESPLLRERPLFGTGASRASFSFPPQSLPMSSSIRR